jgi:hypothetical protein
MCYLGFVYLVRGREEITFGTGLISSLLIAGDRAGPSGELPLPGSYSHNLVSIWLLPKSVHCSRRPWPSIRSASDDSPQPSARPRCLRLLSFFVSPMGTFPFHKVRGIVWRRFALTPIEPTIMASGASLDLTIVAQSRCVFRKLPLSPPTQHERCLPLTSIKL